jgi:hypothetical protein
VSDEFSYPDEFDYSTERHPAPSPHLGLRWADIVRLPRPGWQYIVAPILPNGRPDYDNGVRDIWRDPVEADTVADRLDDARPDHDWRVWSRYIPPFEVDDPEAD